MGGGRLGFVMEAFATEVLEPKLWLAKTKCESLQDAQDELMMCIDALEARLEHIKEGTEPLVVDRKWIESIHALKTRLSAVTASLNESLDRLRAVEARISTA